MPVSLMMLRVVASTDADAKPATNKLLGNLTAKIAEAKLFPKESAVAGIDSTSALRPDADFKPAHVDPKIRQSMDRPASQQARVYMAKENHGDILGWSKLGKFTVDLKKQLQAPRKQHVKTAELQGQSYWSSDLKAPVLKDRRDFKGTCNIISWK